MDAIWAPTFDFVSFCAHPNCITTAIFSFLFHHSQQKCMNLSGKTTFSIVNIASFQLKLTSFDSLCQALSINVYFISIKYRLHLLFRFRIAFLVWCNKVVHLYSITPAIPLSLFHHRTENAWSFAHDQKKRYWRYPKYGILPNDCYKRCSPNQGLSIRISNNRLSSWYCVHLW